MLDVFDRVWDRLSREGACDARGGTEYRRVRAEWLAARDRGAESRWAADVEAFIRRRANVGPY